MDPEPLVSVIVPAHNAGAFIADAIDSVLAQTYSRIEVIVVDDGSTDETSSILAGYGPAINVIRQPNRGVSAARNRALAASHGELVALLDADDRWAPTKIDQQVKMLRARPESVLVHTGRNVIDHSGQIVRQMDLPPLEGHCLPALVRRNDVTASSVMVRRAVLEATPFSEEVPGCEDWDLWLRLAACHEIAYIAAPLIDYRVHGGNLSRSDRLMLESSVEVLTRFVGRSHDDAVIAEARLLRHGLQIALAHHEYDNGEYDRARRAFHLAGRPFGRPDLIRLSLCYLPASLIRALRWTRHALARSEPTRAE